MPKTNATKAGKSANGRRAEENQPEGVSRPHTTFESIPAYQRGKQAGTARLMGLASRDQL
jgi:hypothetical protein